LRSRLNRAATGCHWLPLKHTEQATPEQRAQALLAQMTLDEKILMLHGSPGGYVGNVPANTRLGIPALNLNDGACGSCALRTLISEIKRPRTCHAQARKASVAAQGQAHAGPA
jgi:beta-glucosidase